jgi:hypothetical protein
VRHVVGQRGQRVLHGGGGQPCALQPLDDLRPGRAVGVGAVNQHHGRLGGQRGHVHVLSVLSEARRAPGVGGRRGARGRHHGPFGR